MLAELRDDLFISGQPATLTLIGIHDLSGSVNFKDAVMALLQFRCDANLCFNSRRETRGCREESSLNAVYNLNLCWFPNVLCLAHNMPPLHCISFLAPQVASTHRLAHLVTFFRLTWLFRNVLTSNLAG